MSSIKNAVIAAAGLGSRLGLGMPKAMISVNNSTILGRLIDMLSEHVENIVVVVGYREELIAEYCQNHYRHVILVRNPDYATTNTAQSMEMGAQYLQGKTIFLDGDLLVEKKSLATFISLASRKDLLLGVAMLKTEQPVYASCMQQDDDYLAIHSFSRTEKSPYEWANLFVGDSAVLNNAKGYVFEKLAENSNLLAAIINVEEIDTPEDLKRSEMVIREWDNNL